MGLVMLGQCGFEGPKGVFWALSKQQAAAWGGSFVPGKNLLGKIFYLRS